MSEIKLFTTTRCPKCPEAKQYVADNNLDVDIIVADQDEAGMKLAAEHGIMYVPTFVKGGKQYSLAEFKKL